jgi:hypothetical protein
MLLILDTCSHALDDSLDVRKLLSGSANLSSTIIAGAVFVGETTTGGTEPVL